MYSCYGSYERAIRYERDAILVRGLCKVDYSGAAQMTMWVVVGQESNSGRSFAWGGEVCGEARQWKRLIMEKSPTKQEVKS